MNRKTLALAVIAACLAVAPATAGEKIKVLIIDGQNNHNWKDTTPYLKGQLEKTGKFMVDVSTTPPGKPQGDAWDRWDPQFKNYDVVLSNYNGPAWPVRVRENFEAYIKNGGGLVNVHAANNACNGWPGFEQMTGLLWRNNKHGDRIAFNKDKEQVRVPKGQGPGAGHGPQHAYEVVTVDEEHPITKGLPIRWQHTKDELYHGQRGPAEKMHVMAIAFSASEKRGTGMYEPMLWWIPFGKGKVVTTVLGHVSRNDSKNMQAMRCVGFLTIVQRACEWAATGEVTIPVPENFPEAGKESLIDLN